MITTPTLNLRWREATRDDIYNKHLPVAIQNGTQYILEQQFRVQYADETPELEWRVVEIANPKT